MALALVAEAVLSPLFDILFQKMASSEVVNFFKQRKLDDELLKKLEIRMNTVNGLLTDAEEKQITSPAVKKWLDDLKDIAYETDDFLDEIAYIAHEQQLMEVEARSPKTCSDQVRNFLSSLNPCKKGKGEMQPELVKIFARVEDLLQQTTTLGLVAQVGRTPDQASSSSSHERRTTSLLVDPTIYGRDNNKKAIMQLLLSDDSKGKHPLVIPIVGMGGVGKTTLAQLVYNDDQVKQWFDDTHRAWVCVSEESDIFKVTLNILKELGVPECDSSTPPNQLQLKLKEKVTGKRVLLVLDDIWSERADWNRLLAPFSSAAEGSKVLITTRNEQLASAMSSVPTHRLEVLNEDDCWHLFARHAFDGGVPDAYGGEIEEIGMEIARKCGGLPLAARTLGSLLRGKKNAKEWESILKSNTWDMRNGNIIPALRLSYHYLPSPLKQCFAYCAVFPKDFVFNKEDLVLLWMAEGFIVQPDETRDMEEIGIECFEELACRSFFTSQKSRYGKTVFVMHDLVNDLAKSIAGEFFYNMDDVEKRKPSGRTRHLFCIQDGSNPLERVKSLCEARMLRTLKYKVRGEPGQSHNFLSSQRRLRVLDFSFEEKEDSDAGNILSELVGSLKYLRFMRLRTSSMQSLPKDVGSSCYLQTLILNRCYQLTGLPDSIGKLKELRHFSLNDTKVEVLPDWIGKLKELRHLELRSTPIQKLPDSICGLYNLQTLDLFLCSGLAELPSKMTDLVNLCNLLIRGSGLKYMPVGMGKLVKLQNLADFILGEQQRGSGLGELGELRNLQGWLVLKNLENVVDEGDALRANLKDKKGLRELNYCWNNNDGSDTDASLVLQQLRPHINVERIEIEGFRGTSLPDWLGDSSYSKLVSLVLYEGKHCTHLPPVGQLPFLEQLWIAKFDCVVSVGAEFYYGGSWKSSTQQQPFQSLKVLNFYKMARWEEWISDDDGSSSRRAFPVLERLELELCGELSRVNHLFLPSLVKLTLRRCPKLTFPNHLSLPSLVDLTVVDCQGQLQVLEQLGASSTIQKLYIAGCSMGMVWGLDELSSLSSLDLHNIQDLESFSGRISLPCSLTSIVLWDLQNLKSLGYNGLHHLTSLKELSIWNCPKLQCIPEEGPSSTIQNLCIAGCSIGMVWGLDELSSLSSLDLGNIQDLESFPGRISLPCSLTKITIRNLQNLKSLDYNGLHHLTSLKELSIVNCPELQCIPEEGLPPSLSCFYL